MKVLPLFVKISKFSLQNCLSALNSRRPLTLMMTPIDTRLLNMINAFVFLRFRARAPEDLSAIEVIFINIIIINTVGRHITHASILPLCLNSKSAARHITISYSIRWYQRDTHAFPLLAIDRPPTEIIAGDCIEQLVFQPRNRLHVISLLRRLRAEATNLLHVTHALPFLRCRRWLVSQPPSMWRAVA